MTAGIVDERRAPRQQREAHHDDAVHDLEPGLEAQHRAAAAHAHARPGSCRPRRSLRWPAQSPRRRGSRRRRRDSTMMPSEISATAAIWPVPSASPIARKAAIVVSTGRESARQRIDHAHVADAVGADQQRVVAELDKGGQRQPLPARRRRPVDEGKCHEAERQADDADRHHGHGAVGCRLHHRVPHGMRDRRQDHQAIKNRRRHRIDWPMRVCGGQCRSCRRAAPRTSVAGRAAQRDQAAAGPALPARACA